MLAVVIDFFAFKHLAPDAGEFDRRFVALLMIEVQAITGQLVRIATGYQVEQRPAIGQAIERGGLPRGDRRRDDSRAQGHQELQAFGNRDQGRGHQPGILAGTPGGYQHAAEPQAVGRLGNLLQVAMVHRPGALRGAQVFAITVRGEEPEDVEAHWSCLLRGS